MKHNQVFNPIFIVSFLLITLFSCSNDEKEEKVTPPDPVQQEQTQGTPTQTPEEQARYYVRYEVQFTTQHNNANRVIKYTNEKGEQTIKLENDFTWEGTYGPVDKGFVAKLSGRCPNYSYSASIHGRIYVCREREPFVIKAEDTSREINLRYAIDF